MAKGDKYKALTEYLVKSNKDKIILTFDELEKITGELPQSVYKYKLAWSDKSQHSFSYGWLRAGYSIKEDFENKRAKFTKVRDGGPFTASEVDNKKEIQLENKPDWMPFYKEMAVKLLDYIDKRDELIEKMQFNKLLASCGLKLKLEKRDIDPFTVFALVNRNIFEHLKIDILIHYASVLEIKAKLPTNFNGVPNVHNLNTLFYARGNFKRANDIENLWQLFKSALEYADKKDDITTANFSKWLDLTVLQPVVGNAKITSGLFWIAPDTFLNLDRTNWNYINKLEYQELDLVKAKLRSTPRVKGLRGYDYIVIINEMKKFIESPISPYKDFVDFSSKAYHSIMFDDETDILDEINEEEVFEGIKGYNKIYYGLPGCGKSYTIENKILNGVSENNKIRVTFHQDYTYSDFIGQIMPIINQDKTVTYEFQAGPFIKAIEKALLNPDKNIYLIIEEINRGNAPSIFGDTFQLLDRNKKGKSEFPITNDLVIGYLKDSIDKDKLYIPPNLIILATMNTSDQNVFTLDTAFKRRWDFEEVTNDFTDENHPYGVVYIPKTNVTWTKFYERINREIIEKSNSNFGFEDKRIGAFFIKKDTLSETENNKDRDLAAKFSHKMLEYLWNDVCKFDKQILFESNYRTLSDVINGFLKLENPLSIFNFRFDDAKQ